MKHHNFQQYIHQTLRRSLLLYLVVSIILLLIVVYNLILHRVDLPSALISLILGGLIGVVISRMRKISWDAENRVVTSSIDAIGVGFLVLYVAIEFSRSRLIGLFVPKPEVTVVSLALLAGIFYGRMFGNTKAVIRVLRDQDLR